MRYLIYKVSLTINVHRLQHRLRGSLIPFDPYAFVIQRQSIYLIGICVVPVIRLHSRCSLLDLPISLVPSPFLLPLPDSSYLVTHIHPLFRRVSISSPGHHLLTLYAESLRLTLASVAWPHLLAQSLDETSSLIYVILFIRCRRLQPMPSSVLGIAGSSFRSLTMIPNCCLQMKSGSFSSPMGRPCLSTPL